MPVHRRVVTGIAASGALIGAVAMGGAAPPAATAAGPAAAGETRVGHDTVSQARASRIAEAWIERRRGPAQVTGAEREDDFGARWEIEVTLRSGAEYDVYVTAAGRVVRVLGPGTRPAPARSVGADRAVRIAEAWIERRRGPARVTGAEREDDFGARWEVEMTLPNGVEYDVYVAGDGRVVRVARSGEE